MVAGSQSAFIKKEKKITVCMSVTILTNTLHHQTWCQDVVKPIEEKRNKNCYVTDLHFALGDIWDYIPGSYNRFVSETIVENNHSLERV